MELSDRKTALRQQTCIYIGRGNSSSMGEKGITYTLGNLRGKKIDFRIVTHILLREIKSHKIRCRTWNFSFTLWRQFQRRLCTNCC